MTILHSQQKSKWPARLAFTAAGMGIATAAWWFTKSDYEPVRLLTGHEQQKLKSDPARNPPLKNWEEAFIKETVPGEDRKMGEDNATNAWVEAAKPKELTTRERDEKQAVFDLVKEYYEYILQEPDPIQRYNRVTVIKGFTDKDPDALSALGMTKDQLEGLVKSLQVQAGPALLASIQSMDKYDREKIGHIHSLREIATSLSNNDRVRYYESLGSSQSELQGHFCDGAIAEARYFMAQAMANKADKMTKHAYEYEYKNYLEALPDLMSDSFSKVCEAAGRNVYQESGISEQQIRQLLTFRPEIIPEPAPKPE